MKKSQLRQIIKEEISKILKEDNPYTQWKGSQPTRITSHSGSERLLKKALEDEDYEYAAKLRDQYPELRKIKSIVSNLNDRDYNGFLEFAIDMFPGMGDDLRKPEIMDKFLETQYEMKDRKHSGWNSITAYFKKTLNEGNQPSKLHITHAVPGGRLYSVEVEFGDGSKERFRTLEDAEAKYDLKGVKTEYWEMDVS